MEIKYFFWDKLDNNERNMIVVNFFCCTSKSGMTMTLVYFEINTLETIQNPNAFTMYSLLQ